jgi:hypothetical protein
LEKGWEGNGLENGGGVDVKGEEGEAKANDEENTIFHSFAGLVFVTAAACTVAYLGPAPA